MVLALLTQLGHASLKHLHGIDELHRVEELGIIYYFP